MKKLTFSKEAAKKHMLQKRLKSQSAMEYLMTYGWAILIIAVVLGALFSMGFFNSASLAPKVQPGSCQVLRPYGPGTSAYVTLQGTCINEMPKFVAQFNGQSSYISSTQQAPLNNLPDWTLTAWVNPSNGNIIYSEGNPLKTLQIFIDASRAINVDIWNINRPNDNWLYLMSSAGAVTMNSWNFIAITMSGAGTSTGTVDFYANGHLISSSNTGQMELNSSTHYFSIGDNIGSLYGGAQTPSFFNGSVADIQIYNASLSQSEVTALYRAGIGGDPINLQNLAAWWPLNGNANDYSGNQNSGTNSNVIYTTGWTSSYSAP